MDVLERAQIVSELAAMFGEMELQTDLRLAPSLIAWVEGQLDDYGYSAKDTAWELIRTAVRRRDDEGPPPEKDEKRPLAAARHLLALASEPDEILRDTGMPLSAIAAAVGVKSSDMQGRATLRRGVAGRASNMGHHVSNFRQGSKTLTDISDAVVDEIERLVAIGALEDLAQLESEPKTILRPRPSPATTRRRKVIRIAALVLTLALGVGLFVWPRWVTSKATTYPPALKISAEPLNPPFWNESFWIPATAPIDSIPISKSGLCQSTVKTADAPADEIVLQKWLKKYGVSQYAPTELTVRNVADVSGVVGLSHVVARGTQTMPRQPGFIFYCSVPSGGPIEWVNLLTKLDGSEAHIDNGVQVSDYFWLNLARGEVQGVVVTPQSGQDFDGRITASVTVPGRSSQTIDLPIGPNGAFTFRWHGIPADRLLKVTPAHPAGHKTHFLCEDSDHPEPDDFDCTPTSIRTLLEKLWNQ